MSARVFLGLLKRCSSCRARILWCTSAANNKPIPMDPNPIADGNMWIDSKGIAHAVDLLTPPGVDRYVAHSVTCPHADEHRKAR